MAELKKLSDELESGELTLDESLEVYTKAVELIKICNKKLQDTQKQMTILIENFEGEMKEVPFNEEDYRG
jgi:exodeoxyribonuclease VII small subunit